MNENSFVLTVILYICFTRYKEIKMKNTITKENLITKVSEKTNQPKDVVRAVIQQTFDSICEYLEEGNRLELRRFGVFSVKERRPRVGRNPNSPQKAIQIPASKVAVFKASVILKKQVKK